MAHSAFQNAAVIGIALAPAGRGRGRTPTPLSSASVGNGSVRMPASMAPDSSAGTMSGNGMILTCTSLIVSPSRRSTWSSIHSTAAPRVLSATGRPLRSAIRLISLPHAALRTVK